MDETISLRFKITYGITIKEGASFSLAGGANFWSSSGFGVGSIHFPSLEGLNVDLDVLDNDFKKCIIVLSV